MIVAIASDLNNADSIISGNFGKCSLFCLFNTETKEMRFIENPGGINTDEAGMKAINFLLDNKVEIVVARRFGTKVITRLRKEHIQMVIPQLPRTIEEVINQLKQ